jgi:hypothetical protein
MSSRDSKRRTDSHRSALPTADGCGFLINSVVVAIGGVYKLTGSPLVSAVAGVSGGHSRGVNSVSPPIMAGSGNATRCVGR